MRSRHNECRRETSRGVSTGTGTVVTLEKQINLHRKVEQMLHAATRYNAPTTRIGIIEALAKSGIEPHERWIDYQQEYGGMTIYGYTTMSTYVLDLFTYLEPADNRSLPR